MLPYLLGLVGGLAIGPVRRRPGCRILIFWALGCFVYFWLLESTRLFLYVVHIAPICLVLLVACFAWLIRETNVLPKWAGMAGLAAFLVIQLGGCVLVARRNSLEPFSAAATFLEPHVKRGELMMASAEYGIPLSYPSNLIDDLRLGCQTGKWPDLVVLGARYTDWFRWAAKNEPATYDCIQHRISQDYRLIFEQSGISIIQRRSLPGTLFLPDK
jgi:hypothetical protein